jgi:hypothetical protein
MTDPGIPTLTGDLIRVRPATAADAARLTEILGVDGVAQGWGAWDIDRDRRDLT